MKLDAYLAHIVQWIKQQVDNAQMEGVIFGLSGGIDSSVVARLGQLAFPHQHLAVVMPCDSDDDDKQCALALAKNHQLKTVEVDLTESFVKLKAAANVTSKLAIYNIKPRLRMTTLYSLAQEHRYLVLGTDNYDEWYLGYFTKYGDGGADLLPIKYLTKTDVRQAATLLAVPQVIIDRKPSAGLWTDQTDEAELGFSYQTLDQYLLNQPVDQKTRARIAALHKQSEHKRHPALAPDNLLNPQLRK